MQYSSVQCSRKYLLYSTVQCRAVHYDSVAPLPSNLPGWQVTSEYKFSHLHCTTALYSIAMQCTISTLLFLTDTGMIYSAVGANTLQCITVQFSVVQWKTKKCKRSKVSTAVPSLIQFLSTALVIQPCLPLTPASPYLHRASRDQWEDRWPGTGPHWSLVPYSMSPWGEEGHWSPLWEPSCDKDACYKFGLIF